MTGNAFQNDTRCFYTSDSLVQEISSVAEITDNGKEDERELVQTLSGAQE